MITIQEFQERTEQMHAANVARIQQLMLDAKKNENEATSHHAVTYWQGFHDGLARTLRVLDGRG